MGSTALFTSVLYNPILSNCIHTDDSLALLESSCFPSKSQSICFFPAQKGNHYRYIYSPFVFVSLSFACALQHNLWVNPLTLKSMRRCNTIGIFNQLLTHMMHLCFFVEVHLAFACALPFIIFGL